DDLPYADDLRPAADADDLDESALTAHAGRVDLVEPAPLTGATDLPSRGALRETERLAHRATGDRDPIAPGPRLAEPLSALGAPNREDADPSQPSPARRYAAAARIRDAPRSMRSDLAERHEDLRGEPANPRSAFAHAGSSTTTFIPDQPTSAQD